jgi:hypothetical protein
MSMTKRIGRLQYVLVGSTAVPECYWRWSIFSESEEIFLQFGSFCGSLPAAKAYVEATVWRMGSRVGSEE